MKLLISSKYYHVYEDSTASIIIKTLHSEPDDINKPERLVRIWNELHPKHRARVLNPVDELGAGWICASFKKLKEPSDKEIGDALIHIFETTGRIVLNAAEPNTFFLTDKNQIVCLDVKMALQIAPFSQPHSTVVRYRRESAASLSVDEFKTHCSAFLEKYKIKFPITVETIKSLLFIRINRPEIFAVNFLTPYLRSLFAIAYEHLNKADSLHILALSELDKIAVPGRLFIGSGSYSRVYLAPDEKEVCKIGSDEYNKPTRSIRIWNELYDATEIPRAEIVDSHSWKCLYVRGNQASDTEMAEEIINIFNKTGRIVVDAVSKKNLIKTEAGRVICVDVGLALQLEKREEAFFERGISSRRRSATSLELWRKTESKFPSYWDSWMPKYPKTINTIKALLFIKKNRPDIFEANILTENDGLLISLANAYDQQNKSKNVDGELSLLDTAIAVSKPGVLAS